MNDRVDPVLILGVTTHDDSPVYAPLFAILVVTRQFLHRLTELTDACRTLRLSYLVTDIIEPAPYWDASPHDFAEVSSRWNVIGDIHYGEMSARRRLSDGTYGKVEVIGSTPLISLCELEQMRAQQMSVDFRYHDNPDDPRGEKFSSAVFRRMVAAGIWPKHIHPSVIGVSQLDFWPE